MDCLLCRDCRLEVEEAMEEALAAVAGSDSSSVKSFFEKFLGSPSGELLSAVPQ